MRALLSALRSAERYDVAIFNYTRVCRHIYFAKTTLKNILFSSRLALSLIFWLNNNIDFRRRSSFFSISRNVWYRMERRKLPVVVDMIVSSYNRFHVMLRRRLGKHVLKCHPEETRAKQQQIFKEKMTAWEKEQRQQVPIQPPSQWNGFPPVAEEFWDEDEPTISFVPQLDSSMYINNKCIVYGRK
ncbi:hypothetical protein FQR65_LT12739 [Abscondita terminalis]|nr:hypothetical protein FQR65_LT12739 [Abscondita terminalis]